MSQRSKLKPQYVFPDNHAQYSVGGITVLCHVRKNCPMPVTICENEMHLVTLYNVIFSNMTGIVSHLSYIVY